MSFLQNLYTGEAVLLRRYFSLRSTGIPGVFIAEPYHDLVMRRASRG